MDRADKYMADLKDVEGSCHIVCLEGELEASTITTRMKRDGGTLGGNKVPALGCDTCDDISYTEAIGRELDEMCEMVKKVGMEMTVDFFE